MSFFSRHAKSAIWPFSRSARLSQSTCSFQGWVSFLVHMLKALESTFCKRNVTARLTDKLKTTFLCSHGDNWTIGKKRLLRGNVQCQLNTRGCIIEPTSFFINSAYRLHQLYLEWLCENIRFWHIFFFKWRMTRLLNKISLIMLARTFGCEDDTETSHQTTQQHNFGSLYYRH